MSSSPEDVVVPSSAPTRARRGVRVEFDAEARMRDGAILRANVYRPDGAGPWPTLLARTPYGKDLPPTAGWLDPVQTAERGFMVVIQDTRGRFASDGEWDPFRFEREDGFDSVEWAARLAGSNGRVGMYGASYWGNTQWMAAAERPPSLTAITPSVTWSDPMDGLFARGGAVELGLAVPWTLAQGFAHLLRVCADGDRDAAVGRMVDDWDRLREDGYWDLPVSGMPVLGRHAVPDLGSIRALDDAGIAERCRVDGSYDDVDVPAFQLGGWHDIFLQGTLDNHRAMVDRGVESRLLVGPWTHMDFADPVGELCFGLRASKDGMPAHPARRRPRLPARVAAEPPRSRRRRRAARQPCPDLRHGPQRVARRGAVAARARLRRTLVPARRRRPEPRGAGRRGRRDDVRLRPARIPSRPWAVTR